jgi:hypothetical protein
MNGAGSCGTHAVHVMWRSCVLTAYGLRSWSVDCGLALVLLARFGWVLRGCRLHGFILSGRLRMHIRNRWFACLRNTSFATFTLSPFWLSAISCATDVRVCTRGGRLRLCGFQLGPKTLSLFAFVRWGLPSGIFVLYSAVLM